MEPPRGVLLHGPPGCGKTALANAIANECNVPFLKISAPEVVSGMSGEWFIRCTGFRTGGKVRIEHVQNSPFSSDLRSNV